MDLKKSIDDILTEISGQNAWNWVAKISQYHRIQASSGYHDSLEEIKKELIKIGYQNIEHYKFPADGESQVWGITSPLQWEIEYGELWMVEPEEIKLCGFNEIPISIVTHSKSCDVIAELIDLGKGNEITDYLREDLSDKIILISSSTYMYHAFIEQSNALGVIYYPDLKRTGEQLDKRIYNSFFTTKERLKNAKFGFSISYKQAMHIKELLQKGSVKVHAIIKSEFLEGNLEILTTSIKGLKEPNKEIVIIAHLCHPYPSANDNASGSAGLLELARAYNTLINKKKIKPPNFTIRFVWVPEFNGTIPWMKEHLDKIKNVIACLNLDMIGEHRLKIGDPLEVNRTPYSTPSIINDIALIIIKNIVDNPKAVDNAGTKIPMSYRFKSFEGGSDHILFIDSFFGIPSLMFGHEDPYYHSSMDNVEYVDPTELKRVISMALCISHLLSILDDELILELWSIIHTGILYRWGNVIKHLETLALTIKKNKNNLKEVLVEHELMEQALLKCYVKHEFENLDWLKQFMTSNDILHLVNLAKQELNEIIKITKSNLIKRSNLVNENTDLHDIKTDLNTHWRAIYDGPFPIDKLMQLSIKKEFKEFIEELGYPFLGPLNELVNLMAKNLSLLEISCYLSLEYEQLILPSKIRKLVEILEDEGFFKKIDP